MPLKRRRSVLRSWEADVRGWQYVIGTRHGARLYLNVLYLDHHRPSADFWVNPDPWNPIVQFLTRATEPVLAPIRRRLGLGMGIDLSPLIVIAAVWFVQIAVVQSIKDIAVRMN